MLNVAQRFILFLKKTHASIFLSKRVKSSQSTSNTSSLLSDNIPQQSLSQKQLLLLTKSERFGSVFGSFLIFPTEYFRKDVVHPILRNRQSQKETPL
jgi:hypothetical protein